ncbi:MAG: LysM peptidoglycan-binding domain-containing protein [Betaproteobacteria bacterium]|nr:LysM peptidoglycan-binding domain-containing protein [Betaproteobacteria bacterium]MDE2310276.1 LysM peptidoglycan-binding domain-containing protein [Betaproteobacteria bacterium]
MQKLIISLICCLLPAFALAAAPEIRDNAPDRHIVVKGDTLWDISATFFKDPWKWPQIWGMNKDTIKDPHWIYPGDVIILDRATGTLRIGGEIKAGSSDNVVKLSPRVRAQDSGHDAIPSIPADAIGPFLSRPLIIEENELSGAPTLVGTYEQRVLLGNDDIAYVKGLSEGKGSLWQVYRPGKTFLDPDSMEVLGYEAIYLGDVNVERFGDLSTVRVTKSIQEINKGDRLVQATGELASNYVPHAPESLITARVISIYGGVSQAGQNAIVTLNKGRRDGMENGHVLALYRKGEVVKEKGEALALPVVRYGLLFVFRTFEKVAYALVMQTRLPVELLDSAQTP